MLDPTTHIMLSHHSLTKLLNLIMAINQVINIFHQWTTANLTAQLSQKMKTKWSIQQESELPETCLLIHLELPFQEKIDWKLNLLSPQLLPKWLVIWKVNITPSQQWLQKRKHNSLLTISSSKEVIDFFNLQVLRETGQKPEVSSTMTAKHSLCGSTKKIISESSPCNQDQTS